MRSGTKEEQEESEIRVTRSGVEWSVDVCLGISARPSKNRHVSCTGGQRYVANIMQFFLLQYK